MLRPEAAETQQQQQQQQQQQHTEDALAQLDAIPPGARSPHPYRRQSLEIHDRIFVTNLAARERHQPQFQTHQHHYHHQQPSSTRRRRFSRRDSEQASTAGDGDSVRSGWTTFLTTSPSDSGTEADDERNATSTTYLPGLPPATIKSRKGLIGSSGTVTPSDFDGVKRKYLWQQDEADPGEEKEGQRYSEQNGKSIGDAKQLGNTGLVERTVLYTTKWRAELLRRVLEHVFLCGLTHWCLEETTDRLLRWPFTYDRSRVVWDATEKAKWVVLGVLASYIVKAFWIWTKYLRAVLKIGSISLDQVPSPSDPGYMLYPILIPIAVASAGASTSDKPSVLLLNMVLGLSTYPMTSNSAATANIEWTVLFFFALPHFGSGSTKMPFFEALTFLLPLQSTLVSTVQYFCDSSLLPAESQLLSTGLINLLFFAASPLSLILFALLWIGGLLMLVGCRHILRLSTVLARIPGWRFRSPRHAQARASPNAPPSTAIGTLLRTSSLFTTHHNQDSSDDREWMPNDQDFLKKPRVPTDHQSDSQNIRRDSVSGDQASLTFPAIAQRTSPDIFVNGEMSPHSPKSVRRHRRTRRSKIKPFLWLTRTQAAITKWLFAIYVYAFTLTAILLPIRTYIQRNALHGNEPVGWALSYLLGDLPYFRLQVILTDLDAWIPLPPRNSPLASDPFSFNHIRSFVFGAATTRLLICAWCLANLTVGLLVVYQLRKVVEVDTRRKVFHGMMVSMFLPTAFIDPCFVALALILMLAIFLLLDLFRASQLPPISRPLTHFLAPYVDGRDHKGPVIISPIFLLIGCAIPLWLGLAGLRRHTPASLAASTAEGDALLHHPWAGWEVEGRDLSLVAGIICVGMGDAAASLIGRRYGHRRWIWSGGKSLEGSAAFVFAVSAGLLAAKAWMVLGAWPDELAGDVQARGSSTSDVGVLVGKTLIAGMGASFTEAVLTGGNDNVIVPVILWLLVRCLRI